jgi:hypothetical protein
MAKRKPLSFNNTELSENLQRSAAKGIDAFFSPAPEPAGEEEQLPAKNDTDSARTDQLSPIAKPAKSKTTKETKPKQPRYRDTMQPSNHETVVSRYHDTIIQEVRKAVKELGKEAATHRFTDSEKKEIMDMIYAYKRQGIRTSENEITRIGVNFLIEDYKENGENSVLHKVLQALND